jgi:hypothetical protein
VYKELDAILVDFEDYMACARLGGTNSATLDAKSKNADEDIRATVVQNFLRQIAAENQKSCWAVPINCTIPSDFEQLWEVVKNIRMHEIDN